MLAKCLASKTDALVYFTEENRGADVLYTTAHPEKT